jgi:hypothetical protein
MIPADRFYAPQEGPPKQGDILFAGVGRLMAADRFTPPAWDALDEHHIDIAADGLSRPPLRLAAGHSLVMVTSHDCHFDKQWNRRVRQLMKAGHEQAEAAAIAEADDTLDRTFTASPLVDPDDLDVDRGNLMAGRVLGYLPVPLSHDGLIPEAVVDLTYRCTLDRLDIARLGCVSNEVRAQLRFSLARLDSLRSPEIGFRIEEVIGKEIAKVAIPNSNPLMVEFEFTDGTTIELLQQPGEPGPEPGRADVA